MLRTKKKERKKERWLFCFYANSKEVEEYGFIYLVQNVVKNYVSSFELKKKKKRRLEKMGFACKDFVWLPRKWCDSVLCSCYGFVPNS